MGKRRILGSDQKSNKRLNPRGLPGTNGPRARFEQKLLQFPIRRQ